MAGHLIDYPCFNWYSETSLINYKRNLSIVWIQLSLLTDPFESLQCFKHDKYILKRFYLKHYNVLHMIITFNRDSIWNTRGHATGNSAEEVVLWGLTSLLVGQNQSSSRLVILNSRPCIFATCHLQTWFSSALKRNFAFLFRILPLRFLFYSIFNTSDCRFPLFCYPRKIRSAFMKMSISCFLKSNVFNAYFESDFLKSNLFWFNETFI